MTEIWQTINAGVAVLALAMACGSLGYQLGLSHGKGHKRHKEQNGDWVPPAKGGYQPDPFPIPPPHTEDDHDQT